MHSFLFISNALIEVWTKCYSRTILKKAAWLDFDHFEYSWIPPTKPTRLVSEQIHHGNVKLLGQLQRNRAYDNATPFSVETHI